MTDLPARWTEVALGDVCDVRLGRQRAPKYHSGTQMRPYVRAANVGWDGFRLEDVKSMNFTDEEMAVYELRRGDLLLNEASGSAHEVGKPAIWNNEIDRCGFQNTLLRVRSTGPEPRYLLHLFRHSAESGRFATLSRGAGIFHLGRKALAEMSIPLPPLEEQRRIAAVLDKADELRAKRRAALEQLDSLTQAVFIDMFGDPVEWSKRWPTAKLKELCILSGEYGAAVRSIPFDPELPRYVRITDIDDAGQLSSDPVSPGGSKDEWSRFRLHDGDLLFARSGATVGKSYLHRDGDHEHVFAGYLIRFRPDPSALEPEFAFGFTQSTLYRAWVQSQQRAVAQPNINAKQYGELILPVPPLPEQRRFSELCASVAVRHRAMSRTAYGLDTLFASFQSRAFRGEL